MDIFYFLILLGIMHTVLPFSSLDPLQNNSVRSMYEPGHLEPNEKLCPNKGNQLNLLIMVTSDVGQRRARMGVRFAWGHYKCRRDVSVAFIVGSSTDATVNAEVNTEQYIYNDVIRGKFIDSFENQTLKSIAMLEWVDKYCPNVAFVLKSDDDMYINVMRLLSFINNHSRNERKIYGKLAKKHKPMRDEESSYYLSEQEYAPDVFPDYTTGHAYLFPSLVAHDLYTTALKQPYLKFEDVFITGIVANLTKVKRVNEIRFLNRRVRFLPCNVKRAISIHAIKYHEQLELWQMITNENLRCVSRKDEDED